MSYPLPINILPEDIEAKKHNTQDHSKIINDEVKKGRLEMSWGRESCFFKELVM